MTLDSYCMYLRLLNELYRQQEYLRPDESIVEDLKTSVASVWEDLSVAEGSGLLWASRSVTPSRKGGR